MSRIIETALFLIAVATATLVSIDAIAPRGLDVALLTRHAAVIYPEVPPTPVAAVADADDDPRPTM